MANFKLLITSIRLRIKSEIWGHYLSAPSLRLVFSSSYIRGLLTCTDLRLYISCSLEIALEVHEAEVDVRFQAPCLFLAVMRSTAQLFLTCMSGDSRLPSSCPTQPSFSRLLGVTSSQSSGCVGCDDLPDHHPWLE